MMSQLSKLMKQLNISRVQYDFSMKILKLCLKDYIFRCDFLAEVAFNNSRPNAGPWGAP